MTMFKFKVGDKVTVPKEIDAAVDLEGLVGTVVRVDPDDLFPYAVEEDCANGETFCFSEHELEAYVG